MSDREKMLALVAEWRREAGQLRMLRDVAADRNAEHIEKCANDLLALLTEPTLEEVLAELVEDALAVGPTLNYAPWDNPTAPWFCRLVTLTGTDIGSGPTPLQAASECLRRVKG